MRAGILSVYGYDNFVSASIRWAERAAGEAPSYSNHNANWFYLEPGEEASFPIGTPVQIAPDEGIRKIMQPLTLRGPLEFVAQSTIKGTHLLLKWDTVYGGKQHWAFVLVPKDTTPRQALSVLTHARTYLGEEYDVFSIAKNFIDGLLTKVIGKDIYLARRFKIPWWNRSSRYNICTWYVAWTWELARNWFFYGRVTKIKREFKGARIRARNVTVRWERVRREFLTPDHIWDDAIEHRPDAYTIPREVGVRPRLLDDGIAATIDRMKESA